MRFRLHGIFPQSLAAIGLGSALLLAGCGVDGTLLPSTSSAVISGTVHGGPNPVIGATVGLYATASNGYGGAATLLATTTSGQFGQFSFTPSSYTCPTGQQAYVTVSGGNTGANSANSNSLLMSVIGSCATTGATTNIFVSEATTVAAAYALANFITINGTTVNVSAPAANNASTPACTGSGATLSCTAAGIKHAFQNALNLADSADNGTAPTGQFYTVPPSNPNASVPQALLNTVADAVQTCVNSTGGAAGDGSGCGNLFSYTTPPTTSVAAPVTPTNTLQALINLAKYPTLTPANVTSLYNSAGTTGFFQPTLTAAPTDFSLAIIYKGVTIGTTTTQFTYPYFLTLDYADNVYVASTATSSLGPLTFTSISSNGTSQFNGYTSTTYISPRMMASDTAGHVFLPNNSATSNSILELSTADGSLTAAITAGGAGAPYGVAVDAANNVFYTLGTANTQALYEIASGTTTSTTVTPGGATYTSTYAPEALAFDSGANLWNELYTSSAGTYTNYLANSGTLAAEAFTASPVLATDSTTVFSGYGVVIDGSNNGWANNIKTLYKTVPGATTPTATYTISFTPPGTTTATTAASARYPAMDGTGDIFLPDNNAGSSKLWQFLPGTTNFVYLAPCAAPAAATSCAAGSSGANGAGTLYGPRNAQVDSTGSIWVSSSTNGDVLQIIGTASPTWPALSLLRPGIRPQ